MISKKKTLQMMFNNNFLIQLKIKLKVIWISIHCHLVDLINQLMMLYYHSNQRTNYFNHLKVHHKWLLKIIIYLMMIQKMIKNMNHQIKKVYSNHNKKIHWMRPVKHYIVILNNYHKIQVLTNHSHLKNNMIFNR